MSYSYIKSVFPNFENSNKVYDENLYNNITSLYTDTSASLPKPENIERSKPNYNVAQRDVFEGVESQVLEKAGRKEAMSNTYSDYSEVSFTKPENQNNLSYYNLPIKQQGQQVNQVPITQAQTVQVAPKKIIETFEQNDQKQPQERVRCLDQDCDQYIKHILECPKCKAIAIKQLGVDNDRFRNEEMMEVASYIIFGLFILLLIDSLKAKEK
jgi:hypothetical protein